MKNLLLVAAAAVLVLALLIGLYGLTVGIVVTGIRQDTVVQELSSPDGSKMAQVVDSDQGAMGGATFVQVQHAPESFLFFKITPKPAVVYEGAWGSYASLQIQWQGNDCLLINGVAYPIE